MVVTEKRAVPKERVRLEKDNRFYGLDYGESRSDIDVDGDAR